MSPAPEQRDVVILGAGAAGLMCAGAASGRDVLVLDHARAPGEKIRISGGGRCNFTNRHATPTNFISANPAFCISALTRYTPDDFIALVDRHRIAWHEKTLGQLFCDGSATQITNMLLAQMPHAELRLNVSVTTAEKTADGFLLHVAAGADIACRALVVATGGKSIPKMGASDFGYRLAAQFGLGLVETRPALVPLTFDGALLEWSAPLSGVAVAAQVTRGKTRFDEALLFTHRGLSGPAILQISSYWREGDDIGLALLPGRDVVAELRAARTTHGKQAADTYISTMLPKRLAKAIADSCGAIGTMGDLNDTTIKALAARINDWRVTPSGSEGYRVAEVTVGGVDTAALDSRSMQARGVPGLYFIGEVVDVTGWLGGYNFQWAWSSGQCAGSALKAG